MCARLCPFICRQTDTSSCLSRGTRKATPCALDLLLEGRPSGILRASILHAPPLTLDLFKEAVCMFGDGQKAAFETPSELFAPWEVSIEKGFPLGLI